MLCSVPPPPLVYVVKRDVRELGLTACTRIPYCLSPVGPKRDLSVDYVLVDILDYLLAILPTVQCKGNISLCL